MAMGRQVKKLLILLKTLFKLGTIKKICLVVDSIDVNDSSGSKANVAFILNIKEAGFELRVFHYTQKEIHLPSIECISVPERKVNVMYLLSRSERLFTRWTRINLNPFLEGFFGFSFTFFNDVVSIKKALLKESDFNPDLIITLSKGASFRPHYAVLKLPKFHDKWMAYVHDPYPVFYYPSPYSWKESGFKLKEQFFRDVSVKARYAAFPSLLLKEWMGSYFPNFLNTGVVIPHQLAKYEIQNTAFPTYFDPSKFNLLHAGNLMIQRSPVGLIEGFKLFLKRYSEAKHNARLIFIGSATDCSQMFANLKKINPEIYSHIGNMAFNEVYYLQQNVSVNIILEAKSEISPFLPGKFPHCVAANKPILLLGPNYSETKRLLGVDYPYQSEIDDVEKIAGIIEKLFHLWKQNPDNLLLKRNDLETYLSADYLKKVIMSYKSNNYL